ncbi:MAG: hypothetical protein SGPRY_001644 [Prymnesium sp.]
MNNTSSAADKAVLESLPSSLRSAVLQDIHLCTLSATSTFGEMEAEALKRVCAIVKSVLYLPEEVICLQGDVVTEMCALEHGCILSLSSRALTEAEAASREAEASNSAKARWKGAVSATISSVGSRNRVLPEDFGEAEAESASIKTGERRLPQKRGSILMWRQTVAAVVRVVRRKKDCDVAESYLYQRGTPMCELGFLFGLRQEATLEVVATSRCCVIQKREFMALLHEFPSILEDARSAVLSRLRKEEDPLLAEVEALQLSGSRMQGLLLPEMMYAAATNKLEVLRDLVEHVGVDLSEPDIDGRTALHAAVTAGVLPVVEYLVEQKARVNAVDDFGRTPLANAVAMGSSPVAMAVRAAGGELLWEEGRVARELIGRVREGHVAQLKLLLACGANVNAADYDRRMGARGCGRGGEGEVGAGEGQGGERRGGDGRRGEGEGRGES